MCPFFSIIIPAYNVAPYLRVCLDSVLNQSFKDWECITVDDESSDRSGWILEEYAKKDCRFKTIHQKNVGEGGARNAGLSAAKGEWVFFLDGDDLMLKNSLSRLAECISREDMIIRFEYKSFDDGDALPEVQDLQNNNEQIVDISTEIKMSEFFTYVWQHIFRRSAIEGVQFKKYKRGCDRVFLDDVLLHKVDVVKVVDFCCYGYRRRMGSAMNAIPSRQVLCDEMDHRLDIMEMIDASGKKVCYAGDNWLEGYFIHTLPLLTFDRPDDAREIKEEWRNRLPRLLKCKGMSQKGRWLIYLSHSRMIRPIGDFILYTLPRFRQRLAMFKSLARLYRRIMRHGEFAREK